jgi:hypothetical protein
MSDPHLSYAAVQRGLLKQALPYTLLKGHGGALAFFWAVGAGLLTVVYPMPALAAGLTAAMAALGGLMARGYLVAPDSRTQILRAVLARELNIAELSQEPLRSAVKKGIDVFVEIAAKVAEINAGRGSDGDLERVLATACEMLFLQFASAKRVEEYLRIAALLGSTGVRGRAHASGAAQAENSLALEKLMSDEHQTVREVGDKLEAVVLQLLHVARGATDPVRAANLAEEAAGSLRYLEAVVEARRETAEMIRRAMPVVS